MKSKNEELYNFVNSLPDIINGETVTKDNQHGCQKCKLDKICMYCGLDLRGYTREHKDKYLSPYDVLVLGVTEQQCYIPETEMIRVPVRFVEEFKETIEAYYISTMSDHLKSLSVNHKTFVLYPDSKDFNERKEKAVNYVYDMLVDYGYITHKEHYIVGYNAGAGKECIEIIVIGDFDNVKTFIGNIK